MTRYPSKPQKAKGLRQFSTRKTSTFWKEESNKVATNEPKNKTTPKQQMSIHWQVQEANLETIITAETGRDSGILQYQVRQRVHS